MLARNNKGVVVPSNIESEVTRWVADGVKYLIGFNASGTYSARFALYVKNLTQEWLVANLPNQLYDPEDPWYTQRISISNNNAYVADRGIKLPAGAIVILKVFHMASSDQIFEGTILGG